MVNTYKQKVTTDMWDESWWSLAKSIEQKFEDLKLNEEEVRSLDKREKPESWAPDSGGSTYPGGADNYGEVRDSGSMPDIQQTFSSGDPSKDARDKILAVKQFIRKGIARGKGKSLVLKKCSALVPSTSYIDYNSSEDTLAIVPKTSIDQKLACRSRGAETQDYPDCRKLIKWWDGFFIGKKIMETAQKVKYQMDAKERQEDLALDMASKNPYYL
jgi:hypothetical protein